jgi:AcrR family transcriptional regulator
MPKVTDAHRSARRRQILDAAARCFAGNGFHATSMQDVFRESGLSAGAVYRYFPGKSALVAAIAEEAVGQVTEAIDAIASTDPLPPLDEAMARVIEVVDTYAEADGPARIAIQVWGESLRDPSLHDVVTAMYGRARSMFDQLARRAQAAGQVPADADPEHVGAVLFALVPGYMLQRVLVGDVDPARYRAGLAALRAPSTVAAEVGPAHP